MKDGSYVSIRGVVEKIDDDEMTVNTATQRIEVDLSDLKHRPAQDIKHIKVGDRVFAYGTVDRDFFEGKEIEADAVVRLNKVKMDTTG